MTIPVANLRIAVTGASGQLGSALSRQWGGSLLPLDRGQFPLDQPDRLRAELIRLRPDVLINCAAYTAVDKAEVESELCMRVNVEAVEAMADACERVGALLTQISTDYVFQGDSGRRTPFREDEPLNPQGVYARSKALAERGAANCARHLIIRTCGLYGSSPRGSGNFVDTILRLSAQRDRLRVVDDQVCTPSFARHVAAAVLFLIGSHQTGVFHVVNHGSTTWHQFAIEILRQANVSIPCDPITTAEYNAPAPRPAYSVLDTSRYVALGGPALPAWQDALQQYLAERRSAPALYR
jgi:dTDP-4-dehydrorhamnose reductase